MTSRGSSPKLNLGRVVFSLFLGGSLLGNLDEGAGRKGRGGGWVDGFRGGGGGRRNVNGRETGRIGGGCVRLMALRRAGGALCPGREPETLEWNGDRVDMYCQGTTGGVCGW